MIIETHHVAKRFGRFEAIEDLSLSVPEGAVFALIGPNGAGKTSLINMITGMLTPNAGAFFLGGDDITALAPEARVKRGLARTFQINALFPSLTALDAVTLAVHAETPPGGGYITRVEWDFDGTGAFPFVHAGIDGSARAVDLEITHAFATPGTYFPCVRVTAHRTGDGRDEDGGNNQIVRQCHRSRS